MRRVLIRGASRVFRFAYDHQNLLFVLAALATLSGLAAISGNWLFYRAAYVLAGLLPLCFIWARLHAGGLEVRLERSNERLQVGQEVGTRVRLQSRSMLTKLWLEAEYETDMPGRPPRTVLTLPAKSVRNWKMSMRCARRGLFSAGPVRVTTGDPFGLFRFTRTFGESQSLLVLPHPEPLPYFWAPAAQLPGEGAVHKRTHYVTPNAASIREYHPGDSFSRIHWRSTARTGRLMVKTFEMDPSSNIWLILDLHEGVQAGEGDESTEEYGVRIATSLAYHFLQGNQMLGVVARGSEKIVLEPGRGMQQFDRILEAMALARARGRQPLHEVLEEEGRRLGRHTTVIVITPSTDERWVTALQTRLRQGTRAVAVLLDASSFGGGESEPPVEALAAGDVLAYAVRAGSEISLMLGPAGVVLGASGGRQRLGVR